MKTNSHYLTEASRRMNSGQTEAEYRAARSENMVDVINRGAAIPAKPANLKLIDTATGAEIALPAKRKCWDGYEITIKEFQRPQPGTHGLIRTDKNEVFVPSVCGAKIIDFPPTEIDVAYVWSRL